MADYPEALDNDPDGVSTALEVGSTFWLRGDYADAVKWLRKAVDAAFDEGADERGLELSKAAAVLATTVPTTPAPPPPTSVPAPVEPAPMPEPVVVAVAPPPVPAVPPPVPSVPAPLPSVPAPLPSVPALAVEEPAKPAKPAETSKVTMSGAGLPLPRVTSRPLRTPTPAPTGPSATRTSQGVGTPHEPAMLTPFARMTAQRVATPPRAVEVSEPAKPAPARPTADDVAAQEINERTPTRPLDEPSVEELVNSAFPDPPESSEPPPAPKARVRASLWNSTDAIRVAVSREGDRCVIRVFDGADLQEGELEAVMIGLGGGPELADMLRVFGDAETSSTEKH